MKLTNDKVFDILPYVGDIMDKLKLDEYVKANKTENKEEVESKGIDLIKYILKNSKEVKEEVFNIVAIVEEKEVKEVSKQNPISTFKTFKKVFGDKELMNFFKQAMQ